MRAGEYILGVLRALFPFRIRFEARESDRDIDPVAGPESHGLAPPQPGEPGSFGSGVPHQEDGGAWWEGMWLPDEGWEDPDDLEDDA